MPYYPPSGSGSTPTAIVLASNFTVTTTVTDVPGMSWSLEVGEYEFYLDMSITTGSGSVGTYPQPYFTYTGTSSSHRAAIMSYSTGNKVDSVRATQGGAASGNVSGGAWVLSVSTIVPAWGRFWGSLVTTGSGTFTFRFGKTGDVVTTLNTYTIGNVYQT